MKIKNLIVSADLIPHLFELACKDFPASVTCVRCYFDTYKNEIVFTLQSDEFENVPAERCTPELQVECKSHDEINNIKYKN